MLITNTNIVVDKDSRYYNNILKYFVKIEEDVVKKLYTINDDEDLILDRGFRFLLPKDLIDQCDDETTHDIDVDVKEDPEFYRNILDGITLRDDQIITVMKCLYHKRGLCQLPTGSGKTICIAAILKYYYMMLGYYPNTLIFEPTNYLVEDMISRFNSYGIPATKYKDHRNEITGVTISHPLSLYNDLMKDEDIFSEVKIFIGDEFHHQSCDTWYTIYNSLKGVEVALGFSASIIDVNKLPIMSLSKLTYNESVIIGCTGNIIMNILPSFYIEKGILARPVVIRMSNPASEWVFDDRDWNQLRREKLESKFRTKILCDVSTLFNIINYKVLILVSTKSYAKSIMESFRSYGMQDKCVCSFGGGVYLKMDDSGELIDCKDEDPKEKFNSGEFNIMIGTTHLYEGADIPDLDVIILAEVGRQPRKLIQGVGRSLRKSKHGHYAYIIDFTDHNNGVLQYHSKLRMGMYKELIGVNNKDIYDYCTLSKLKNIIHDIEGL